MPSGFQNVWILGIIVTYLACRVEWTVDRTYRGDMLLLQWFYHAFPCVLADYLRKGAPFPQSGYDELDTTLLPPRSDHYRITPSPGPGVPGDRFGE